MTRSISLVLSLAFAAACQNDVRISNCTTPGACADLADSKIVVTEDMTTAADMVFSLSATFPLNGTYIMPADAGFGCNGFTNFNTPDTFSIISDPVEVNVYYMGALENSWPVGDKGGEMGAYTQNNRVFTINVPTSGGGDILTATTSGLQVEFTTGFAATCQYARK